MDGVHDMGGMHGFGRIPLDDDHPPFRENWEGRVFASNLALAVYTANIDRIRFLIESIPPAQYLTSSYYERWLASTLAAAQENAFLDDDQLRAIAQGRIPDTSPADIEAASPAIVDRMLNAPSSGVRDFSGTPRFVVGQLIRAGNRHIAGHTRLPRYVRGHPGIIVKDNGNQVFADVHAQTGEIQMQRLYTVAFRATDLWGEDANPRDSVRLDLWETYLDEP